MVVILRNTKAFVLRYYPVNKPSHVALRYLTADVHPLQPKIAHMYATRDKDMLWWMINPSYLMSTKMKRVVRSWCSRRARMAFQLALKEHGYDTHGRRTGEKSLDAGKEQKDLKGRVELVLHADIIRAQFEDLQKEMNAGVDALIDRMGKNAHPKPGKKKKSSEATTNDQGTKSS